MRKISKKLITKSNYKGYISLLDGKIYVSKDMVLTPGVKDIIRNKGIVIFYGEKTIEEFQFDDRKIKQSENINTYCDNEIDREIIRLLTSEYGITEINLIQKIVEKVFDKL